MLTNEALRLTNGSRAESRISRAGALPWNGWLWRVVQDNHLVGKSGGYRPAARLAGALEGGGQDGSCQDAAMGRE